MFFLVDRAGGVRGLYGGLDDGSVARLVTDAAGLLADEGRPNPGVEPNEARPPTTAISRGAALFQSVGCSACHSDPKIAPPLAGLSGKAVRLQGAVAIADDLYLRQSIVDPEAKIVAGYSLLMPSYRGRLADSEIDDLVSYLHSLGPAEGSASPAPTGADEVEVHDPVCGMKLAPSRAAASASALGATYFFCSDRCRDQFVRDPSRYALRGGSHGPAER
jgi:YHS domain-containing protein/mono/diheme cytochrome c family protein